MRTVVFVDGFNLYRGLLRGRPQLKWLDLYKLFQEHVLSDAHVSAVKFFTADIGAISVDDPGSPLRQRSYLKALAEYRKNVDIIRGKFVSHKRNLRLAAPGRDHRGSLCHSGADEYADAHCGARADATRVGRAVR